MGLKKRKCVACKKFELKQFLKINEKLAYLKCQFCGLVFLEKYPTKRQLEKTYSYSDFKGFKRTNTALVTFAKFSLIMKLMYWQSIIINKLRTRSITRQKRQGKILDVGAGPGTFLACLDQKKWEVYGTEMGKPLVKKLSDMFGKDRIWGGEIQHMKFDKTRFDGITFWHVFEHIMNIDEVVEVTKKLMNKNAVLVIEVPHSGSLNFRLFRENWTLLMPPQHLHLWSESALRYFLNSHGLKITRVEFPAHFPFILFSSLVKVNYYLVFLFPILVPISFFWTLLIFLVKKGDVIRVYVTN